MYPATVKLQGNFLWDAQFESESKAEGGGTFKPTTFMAKSKADAATALLQRANTSEDSASGLAQADPDFEFFDGFTMIANIEMCAEWCALIEECSSFEFVELEEVMDAEHLSPFGRCVLHTAPSETADEPPFGYMGEEFMSESES
ncbi:unnamed protein product [Symbiodinium pilosum]|uniref:Uncharacterized protein n=1 Tax=Symbiodinium pilosum TaxID=2952 RepID=A0A812Y558_SYMPI|nr:unnamed protein product [Symbiodinium pilosum]